MNISPRLRPWLPVALLGLGCALSLGVSAQIVPVLRGPLSAALPDTIGALAGADAEVSEEEAAVAGFTDYALRVYENPDTLASVRAGSIYLGYYDRQTRGRTIHSPKNCLPGGGWEALESGPETLQVGGETVTVNRYMLQNGDARAMVLYWYQGRGRVAWNEYLVKWDLLRDAVLKRRIDEALVRIVVSIGSSPGEALAFAREVATRLKPSVDQVLPI